MVNAKLSHLLLSVEKMHVEVYCVLIKRSACMTYLQVTANDVGSSGLFM